MQQQKWNIHIHVFILICLPEKKVGLLVIEIVDHCNSINYYTIVCFPCVCLCIGVVVTAGIHSL